MLAQLLFAHGTGQGFIGLGGKTLRMKAEGDLPLCQNGQRHQYQAAGVIAADKDQRGAHHGKVPVVDAAGTAAAIAHKPALKGTKPQDADHVANAVSQADQHQDPLIDDVQVIQQADGTV